MPADIPQRRLFFTRNADANTGQQRNLLLGGYIRGGKVEIYKCLRLYSSVWQWRLALVAMKLTQKGYGLHLVVDERVGVLGLKLVDELDDVAVAVLAKVLGAHVCQLILALDEVDADLALLHQFLLEKYLSLMCFARRLQVRLPATCSADVLSIYSGTLPKLSSKPSSNIMLEQNTAYFLARATATGFTSIVDCAVSLCSPTLRMIAALASVTVCDDVELPLSGLLPQLASEKAESRKPPPL